MTAKDQTPTTPWWMKTFYSLDTETTSANPAEARVLAGSLVRIDGGFTVANEATWLINPGVEIPQGSIDVHGLTQEFIEANGVDPLIALEELLALTAKVLNAGYPLVVFNAAYDLSVLETEAKRYGLPTLHDRVPFEAFNRILDPHVLGKGVQHILRRNFVKGANFKLPSLCQQFGVEFIESHDATADAVGAGRLLAAIIQSEPRLQTFTPNQFWTFQRAWRRSMQAGLREYFDKNNIEHDGVDPSWPFYAFVTE